jgi:hypothetical protein
MHKRIVHLATAIALTLSGSLFVVSPARGQTTANVFPPEWVTRMNIPRMSQPPTIDGRIDAEEWREAVRLMGAADDAHAVDFAGVDLAFYVAWDDEHLYLAGHAPLPENKRLVRQRRERFTSEVIWDDAFEFGISLLGRNRAEGEVDSFFKFIINSLGAGEYIRIYPNIGQYLYNWRPEMAIGNGVHDIDGRRVWQIEIAIPLDDLSMPREHRAGDPVRLLFNQSMKLGDHFGWNPIPTASGFLVDTQWPTGLLTRDQPYAQVRRLGGLHQDRVELTVALVNPSDRSVTVDAKVLVRNEGQDPSRPGETLPDRVALDERRLIEVPAGEEVLFTLDRDLEGMTYSYGEYRDTQGRRGYFQMTFTTADAPDEHPVYHFATAFKRKDGPNVFTAPLPMVDDEAFPLLVRFNPVASRLFLSADTLDADKLAGRQAAAMTFRVVRDDETIYDGRIDRFVHHKFEGLADIPELDPGDYRVIASLVDAGGNVLLEHEGLPIRKLDEAREFHHWWGNQIGHTDRLLKPFEEVQVSAEDAMTEVVVTRRRYTLDGLGLPAAITSNGGEVMTEPARIIAVIDGVSHAIEPTGRLRVTQSREWEAHFEGHGRGAGLTVTMVGRIEQDGLADLRITFDPDGQPVSLDELRIEWPLDDSKGNWVACIGVGGNYSARFIDQTPAGEGRVWNTLDHIGNVGSGMTVGNFYGNLWVGNEKRGLLWTADSDEGWVPRDDAPAHSLTRRGDTLVMTNHLISPPAPGAGPFKLDQPRTVHVQYMASPFRHLASGWRLNQGSSASGFSEPPKYKIDWDTGQEYFSILSPPFTDRDRWPEYFAHTSEVAKQRSLKGLTVVWPRNRGYLTNQIALRGYMMKTREPGLYDYFRADWLDGGNETLNDTYTDYMMYLIDRHIGEGGLAHVYYDIAMAMVSDALIAGFGYPLPDGRVQPTSMDGNVREWFKRNWALFQDHGLYPGGVSGHATNAIILKSLPWTDAILDSEFSMPDPIDAYPAGRMIAMSVPHAFGTVIDHLNFMNPHWAALHDSPIGGGMWFTAREGGNLFWTPQFRLFGITRDDVRFIPYWRNDIVHAQPENLLVSAWVRPGAAILSMLNHGTSDPDAPLLVDIALDLEALGVPSDLPPSKLRVEELVIDGNRISVRWGVIDHAWFRSLPLISGDPTDPFQVRHRDLIRPNLDPVSGTIEGFTLEHREFRYLLVTWDGREADPQTLALFADDGVVTAAINWGLFHAQTRQLTGSELHESIKAEEDDVTIHAWHRGDGVLIRVNNPGEQTVHARLTLDLEALGIKVDQLWRQFYLTFDLSRQVKVEEFDGWAGTLAVPLEPGETRVIALIRN